MLVLLLLLLQNGGLPAEWERLMLERVLQSLGASGLGATCHHRSARPLCLPRVPRDRQRSMVSHASAVELV